MIMMVNYELNAVISKHFLELQVNMKMSVMTVNGNGNVGKLQKQHLLIVFGMKIG